MENILQAIIIALGGFALICLIAVLIGFPTMLLWNWLMPVIFGLPTVSLWQAIGLNLLGAIFFNGGSTSKSK